jgi:hypothetical protein
MAFIDNSGDIILDAVLTDTGRMRLAKGDGSFRIVKFALGDDEINYGLYNRNHPSGSTYYDLEIMQTPVLEAFTNNASFLKSKLLTLPRNDFTFLPVILVNNLNNAGTQYAIPELVQNGYVLAVDKNTQDFFTNNGGLTYKNVAVNNRGILQGFEIDASKPIRLEQGLNTTEITQTEILDPSLKEQQYSIEFDSKFGTIAANKTDSTIFLQTPSYIDDDGIATYFFSKDVDTDFVNDILTSTDPSSNRVIRGPLGTKLEFKIKSSLGVQTNNYLFENLGSQMTLGSSNGFDNYITSATSARSILTSLRITGVTTGVGIDIPILLVKIQ